MPDKLAKAQQILKKFYGYSEFRQGQREVVEALLAGRDTVAIMPTGAGKSICFQLPALLSEGLTLVISPLISLMKDQVDSLRQQGIAAAYLNSSLTPEEFRQTWRDIVAGYYKLVYIAPERLSPEYLPAEFRRLNISMIAVDEAHCLSQWGHDFRPSYLNIVRFKQSLSRPPLMGAFTATATPEVKADIIKLLGLNEPQLVVTGFDRPNLSFTVLRGEHKDRFIVSYAQKHQNQSGIIYAGTRKDVDAVTVLLQAKGIRAGRYHAGMSDEERRQSQEAYLYDEINVMVATNAFGMGIDKPNVRYVIHYTMPKNLEAYYQEAGRAGRDGLDSECILLYSAQDKQLQRYLIDSSTKDKDRLAIEYRQLQSMIEYCHTPECLRSYIRRYFGETEVPDSCNNCSSCLEEGELLDITVDAQKVICCVYRMHERFGARLVAEVLKGSNTVKVRTFSLDKLSTYGLLKSWKIEEIVLFINRLVAMQYLSIEDTGYPLIRLNPASYEVMYGRKRVWQKIVTVKVAESRGELFEALRELRRELAAQSKLPPYMIFSDATLQEMASRRPRSMEELHDIKGVGELKLRKYGKQFLTVINND